MFNNKRIMKLEATVRQLERNVETLMKTTDKLMDDVNLYKRIITNAKHGEITFCSDGLEVYFDNDSSEYRLSNIPFTRIYKDMMEYKIDFLVLHNATFKCSENNKYQLYVEDNVVDGESTKVYKYIVDLNKLSFTDISNLDL